jgi:hypothetical protein
LAGLRPPATCAAVPSSPGLNAKEEEIRRRDSLVDGFEVASVRGRPSLSTKAFGRGQAGVVGVSVAVGSGVSEAVGLGVADGVSVAVGVGVEVGKGVNVVVAVGGAKVGEAVTGGAVGVSVAVGGTVAVIVGLGTVGLSVGDGVAVASPGALRIAMIPVQ